MESLRTVTPAQYITESDYRPLKVTLEKKAHVYDLRAKKYLGYTDTLDAAFAPSVAHVYALSPVKIAGVSVHAKCTRKGAVRITAGIDGMDKIKYTPVVRMDVFDPSGNKVVAYSKNIVLDAKSKTGDITYNHALNDQKGTWNVTITDVLSGIQKKAQYKLK